MKIWRCTFHGDPYLGTMLSWHRSKRDAMNGRLELAEDVTSVEVDAVEIPTDKSGLVAWLNHNFNTDNG